VISRTGPGFVLTKLISLILSISILFTPVGPVFAAFGDGSPTIPNSTVFTQASEVPRVDGPSGAFTQSISLDIPPGRAGLQPTLTLDYNSQRKSDSIVGYGWTPSVPYIQRLNKTGSQNLYSSTASFSSSIDGELVSDATSSAVGTVPTILDSLPLTTHAAANTTSDSFAYTVPSGGTNKLFVVMVCKNDAATAPTLATLNGVSLPTFVKMPGTLDRCGWFYSYLAAPTSGTFQINFSGATYADYVVMTLQNAAQSNPDDASAVHNAVGSLVTVSTTTSSGSDLFLSMGARITDAFTTYGSGQTQLSNKDDHTGLGYLAATWKAANNTPGTESASGGAGDSVDTDWSVLAIKAASPPSVLTNPSILDTLPLTIQTVSNVASSSFAYTVPIGGKSKLEVVMLCSNTGIGPTPTASQNGALFSTFVHIPGSVDRCNWYYAYLANPSSGTFQINFASAVYADYVVMTLQGAEQVVPDDISAVSSAVAPTVTSSITTSMASDLLLSMGARITSVFNRYGTGQSEIANLNDSGGLGYLAATWKAALTRPGTETTSGGALNSVDTDWAMVGIKPAAQMSTTTTYRAKVDDGSFNAYTVLNNTWTAYDKSGTRYLYGSDDTGRMYDTNTGTSTETYKWMLQEVRDTNNNYIKYTYLRDGNVLYPYKITYTGYNTTDGPFIITFATSSRPDLRINYDAGFVATTSSRISQITAAVNGTNVRQYNLSYATGNNGYRSLLSGIGQMGWDENGALASTPTTTFSYVNSGSQFFAPANLRVANSAYVVADANGNGENDISVIYNTGAYVWPENAVAGIGATTPGGVYWAVSTSTSDSYTPQELGVRLIDTNADGKPDLVVGYRNGGSETFAEYLNTYATSTGAYSWTSTSTWIGSIPHFGVASGGNYITTGIFGA
jgi:hypothetical protein